MKNIYRVQRMSMDSYNAYMGGSYNYWVEELDIEANSPEEAVELAKAEGYVVNDRCVKSVEEIEAEEKAREEARKAEAEKKANAKARKAEAEARKAAEAGMSVEEYRKDKARKANIRKMEREIAELEAELLRKKAYLAKLVG